VQCPLRGQRGGQCVGRARKDRVQAIAGGLEDHPAVRFNARTQQAIVASKRGLHRMRVLLPQPCAALDVGEEKAYHALGQLRWVVDDVFYSIRHIVWIGNPV
jgi:hypothetical protein